MLLKGSLSFKGRELETRIPDQTTSTALVRYCNHGKFPGFPGNSSMPLSSDSGDSRHHAALRLQKVYRSFRTRRKLADCAVIVEQKWWKVLDFAELKLSSISFFDVEGPESAISRWSRARTRAAKVGKGLSKDEKARKLALQHWLEAIDPRHRYGHNLQYYYVKWLHCQSKEPFFYWLDIGEGKEVNLVDRCPRSRLQQQCIKYLGPVEREAYEVVLESGKFIYKQSGKILDTTGGPKDAKWIFVLSTSKTLYVGQKIKGTFQHSSFLAGGATLSAGRLVVKDGSLKAVWPHSGHYLPTEENFQAFMLFLMEHNVDLAHVKKSPAEEDDENIWRKAAAVSKSKTSRLENIEDIGDVALAGNEVESREQDSSTSDSTNLVESKWSRGLRLKISKLEIPCNDDSRDTIETLKHEERSDDSSSSDGYETAEDSFLSEKDFLYRKMNMFDEDEVEFQEPIPQETILQRINSHRRTRSYQLGEHLSFRWTTGAGPRIGCVRDYPSRLQFMALEQVNLSPRSRASSGARVFAPSHLRRETIADVSLGIPLSAEPVTVTSSPNTHGETVTSSPNTHGEKITILVEPQESSPSVVLAEATTAKGLDDELIVSSLTISEEETTTDRSLGRHQHYQMDTEAV